MTHHHDGEAQVVILDAIKRVRQQAADERAALHVSGEPLTDYGSGVLDGLDKAWIAGKKAARRPEDARTTTSPEEWWACENAYLAGVDSVLPDMLALAARWQTCGCRPVCWHRRAADELYTALGADAPAREPSSGVEWCTCDPAEVEQGFCVICGNPFRVGGAV